MFKKTFEQLGKVAAAIEDDMKQVRKEIKDATTTVSSDGTVKRLKIVHKDGHITITGDFKSLTVNGKVIQK